MTGKHHYTVTGACVYENGAVTYWTTARNAREARKAAAKRAPECDELTGPVFRGWLEPADLSS